MRLALVKPDWRIRGGFEIVVDRVVADFERAGHEVRRITVDVPGLTHAPFGVTVPDGVWTRSAEWFSHLRMLDEFRALDLSGFDAVVSTQPPSYAVDHPRQLALFYHHARAFYDLEDVWVRAGRASAALHPVASDLLRSAESADLARVTHFLAGSTRIRERLLRYQGPDVPVSLYQAPGPRVESPDTTTFGHVLTVSRHEFTKRTELSVAALALCGERGVLVGSGGRQPFVEQLASRIASGALDPCALTDEDTWLNLGTVDGAGQDAPGPANVEIRGRVDDAELDRLYRSALCVVAPAYDEDDGLTVLEAMAHGRPVVVCRDGGGLTALVEDGVNGLVVEPDAVAIAEAVATLAADPALVRRMGAAGIETARGRTDASARAQLLTGLDIVMGS